MIVKIIPKSYANRCQKPLTNVRFYGIILSELDRTLREKTAKAKPEPEGEEPEGIQPKDNRQNNQKARAEKAQKAQVKKHPRGTR